MKGVLLLLLVVGLVVCQPQSNDCFDNNDRTPLEKQILFDVHPQWVRERCQEPFYSTKFQPLYNTHHPINDVTITNVHEHPTAHTTTVTFSDDTTCSFSTLHLRQELSGKTTLLQSTAQPPSLPLHLWDSSLLSPSFFNHSDVLAMQDETRRLLSSLLSVGIAVISDIPRKEGECTRFSDSLSFSRRTEWGVNFNVRSAPDIQPATPNGDQNAAKKEDLAYTAYAIGMHVDSPYRSPPPAYQLLHAIDHCHGEGCYVHNVFVDGFFVAEKLRKEDPEAFKLLSEIPLRWENDGGDGSSSLVRWAPMIEVGWKGKGEGGQGERGVIAINFGAKSGGYGPAMGKEEGKRFYEAKKKFSQMLHAEENIIKVQLFSGGMVVFDNRRVLHSRSKVLDSDGERWLQGCYMNKDGVEWLYEHLRRTTKGGGGEGGGGRNWKALKEVTKEDCDVMGEEYGEKVAGKAYEKLVGLLELQKGEDNFLGAPVTLYHHGLQTATRAVRGGEDDELVVVSLFHDVMETIVAKNHGEGAAALLAPWISPKNQWLLAHHEIFQGYYYYHHYGVDRETREMFREKKEYYEYTIDWCEKYDQASFDPDYPTLPLSFFQPLIRKVLSRPQYWWNPTHPKAAAVTSGGGEGGEGEKVWERDYGCWDTYNCHPGVGK